MRLKVKYDDECEILELDYNYMEEILRDIIEKNNSLSNENTEDLTKKIASIILKKFDNIDLSEIDSKKLAKVVKKISKDFKKKKNQNQKKLSMALSTATNGYLPSNVVYAANCEWTNLNEVDSFYKNSIMILDEWYEKLQNNNKTTMKNKYDIKYISSNKPNRSFSVEGIDSKKYLKAMKNYGKYVCENAKYGVAGAAIGIGIGAVIPASTFVASATGAVTFARLAYSATKFTNKIYGKITGKPTKIDKMIATTKNKIKNYEISRKYVNEEDEEFEEIVKFSDTKIYKGIQKINNFLKKPSVQWFMNGMALGYRIGDALNLNEKLQKVLKSNQKANVTLQNETLNLHTEATEPTIPSTETNPAETMMSESAPVETIKPVEPKSIKPSVPSKRTNSSTDYSWLDIGKDGDKIDLTKMTEGFGDSYAARGAYKGEYEHLNKAFNLASQYATEENGTFISEIILPDGSIFEGSNVGELLDMGIDPSKCAVNICNINGNYVWGNLKEVLESLLKTTGRGR